MFTRVASGLVAAMPRVGSLRNFSSTALAKGIKMLKDKGVYANRPDKQAYEFACLSNADYEPLNAARKRLTMLMATEHDKELGAADLHTFSPEEFAEHDVYMIDDARTRVQRHQRTGLCYLHAPVSLGLPALHCQ